MKITLVFEGKEFKRTVSKTTIIRAVVSNLLFNLNEDDHVDKYDLSCNEIAIEPSLYFGVRLKSGDKLTIKKKQNIPIYLSTTIEPEPGKKIKSIKSYNITSIEYEDGSGTLSRENKGFSGFELFGTVSAVYFDLKEQMLKPKTFDKVERIVNKDGNKVDITKKDDRV